MVSLAQVWLFTFISLDEVSSTIMYSKTSLYQLTYCNVAEVSETFKGNFFSYTCLVQVIPFSQNVAYFVFCFFVFFLQRQLATSCMPWEILPTNYQLNIIDSSRFCKSSSWCPFVIPYPDRSFPVIKISLGLVCNSFLVTVTISQIKLEAELSLNTLVLIF